MEEDQPTSSTTNKTKGPFFRLAPPPADSGGEDRQNTPQRKESINTEGTGDRADSTNTRSSNTSLPASNTATTNSEKTIEKASIDFSKISSKTGSQIAPLNLPSFYGSPFPPPSATTHNNVVPLSSASVNFNASNGTNRAHSMFGQINGNINNKAAMATSTALLTNTNSSTIFRPLIHDVANKQVAEKLATFLYGIQKKNLIGS